MKKDGNRCCLLDYGYVKLPDAQHSMPERLGEFSAFFEDKIQQFSVTHIAVETPFLGKSAANFIKLGYLRGLLYLLAYRYSLHIFEFSPREIKLSLTGCGAADKEQVSRIVLRMFPGLSTPKTFDITDAIAVTVCAVWKCNK